MSATRIPDAVRAHVKERDNGCLGPRAGMDGRCEGVVEQDHILNGGMRMKGPSVPENLASLCSAHHERKTTHAKQWRPVLVMLVADLEAKVGAGLWPVDDSPEFREATGWQYGGFRA